MLITRECISTKKLLAPIILSGNSPATLTLSYSTEDLSRIIFCECVLGVGNIPQAENFAHFWAKRANQSQDQA